MGGIWAYCEKCKETTLHKIDFDDEGEQYYRCDVCAGNVAKDFMLGYKKHVEEQRKKAGVKNYKIEH